jgi:predicted transcriptional regulator
MNMSEIDWKDAKQALAAVGSDWLTTGEIAAKVGRNFHAVTLSLNKLHAMGLLECKYSPYTYTSPKGKVSIKGRVVFRKRSL